MSEPSVAFFAMPEAGHFQRLRPLISDLTRGGVRAYVFTDRRFAEAVESAGGRFVDLFAAYPIDAADGQSLPVPCRYVSFAGAYAEKVAAELAELEPALVIYDTFAAIGHVVARLIQVPYINICAGHNMDPSRFLAGLETDSRVSISPSCRRWVEVLRNRHGMEDASPFSYVSGLSPYLNVYCEPPAYLTEAERRIFEPVAFYGSLPSLEDIDAARPNGPPAFEGGERELKVYVSFGTVVWRYWASEALEALSTISKALARKPDARGLISLAGVDTQPEVTRALSDPSVSVAGYVDQWRVLQEADVFITHQGLNATHEAVFNLVPMVSYPFFWDQPALAERCREFGLAVPLVASPRGPVSEEAVVAALAELAARRDSMHARLVEARGWERDVIRGRGAVVDRITDLIDTKGAPIRPGAGR